MRSIITPPAHRFANPARLLRAGAAFLWLWIWGTAPGQPLMITWKAGSETDIAGYKVYHGPESRRYTACHDAGANTYYALLDTLSASDVYIAVTAYDQSGNESAYSQEVMLRSGAAGAGFSLEANYPNPFNPVTRIPYALMETLPIRLVIYDILGRTVKVIVDEEKSPGQYEAFWNGTDGNDRQVANGVYFCRLTVGQFCVSRKLILSR